MDGSILTNRSAKDRNKTDYYRTPHDVTVALLDYLEQEGHLSPSCDCVIWEPACGTGEMVEALREKGYCVAHSDLNPTGYGGDNKSVDFLKTEPSDFFDWIITNPPFSQAEKFIYRALELDRPFAFLLKSQFWHAKKRLELFEKHPPAYVLPLTWRPDFLWGAKSGSPTMECIWTVWLGSDCFTEYYPLRRPPVNQFDI